MSSRQENVRTACLVILAGIAATFTFYFGREFFVPIAFAVVLNAVCRPFIRAGYKLHLPAPLSAAIVVCGAVALITWAGFALARPLQTWINNLPEKFLAAEDKLKQLRKPVQQVTDVANKLERVAEGTETTQPAQPPAPQGPGLLARFFGATWKIVSQIVEVLLILYLLLAADDLFYNKLIRIIPLQHDKAVAAKAVHDVESAVFRYLLVTAMINLGQGAIVGLVLWWLKMPNPLLWGMATFVLEFIPYLGAAVMVTLLAITAFATFDQLGTILAAPGSYLVITTLQNNVVSPIAYGQRLKLNPVAVLVGVLFWWFVWGIPGAFLAVPIIATIKIVADRTESFKAVGEFLGE